ncbi:DUF2141 domain-containing protein [Thalassospiraceae bacterium LMO-SO8]|nr:DUF2141 domain-containing protein [Alphaproteobacteria bacterium LMO-S08]WND74410.1 DUF2141 domain-containing protein [Thalassospiraceae bacterium LMO-SO8]
MFRIALISLSMFCALAAGAGHAADLTVTVTGLRSDDGDVHMALYDRAETFPKSDGMLAEGVIPPSGRRASWVFKDIKPGRYAVAVYHDANGDHSFDQGPFGIPLEDYGFSMGARAFLSAPDFDDAAFPVTEEGRTVTIDFGN